MGSRVGVDLVESILSACGLPPTGLGGLFGWWMDGSLDGWIDDGCFFINTKGNCRFHNCQKIMSKACLEQIHKKSFVKFCVEIKYLLGFSV